MDSLNLTSFECDACGIVERVDLAKLGQGYPVGWAMRRIDPKGQVFMLCRTHGSEAAFSGGYSPVFRHMIEERQKTKPLK